MAKFVSLDIPQSCHESWDAMSPRESGRHCGSCNKTVIDFTLMSDSQIAAYFKKAKGETCGRFYNDQLNRALPVPKKELPWLKYFFTVTFPAFLFSQKTVAQKVFKADIYKPVTGALPLKDTPGKFRIAGAVYDESGNPVVGATVMIKGTRTGAATDEYGKFDLGNSEDKSVVLHISSTGFEDLEMSGAQLLADPRIVLKIMSTDLTPVTVGAMGMVTSCRYTTMGMIGYASSAVKPGKTEVSEKSQLTVKDINVYPNPLPRNSFLNISFNEKVKDNQFIEIFSAEGNLVQTAIENPLTKNNSVSILIKNTPRGPYIVRVTNMKTGQKLSKEFIVM